MIYPQHILRNVQEEMLEVWGALQSRRFWWAIACTFLGLIGFSFGVNSLLLPHHFLAAGATGIALLLYYTFGTFSVGVFYWLLNLPILWIGWRVLSLRYVVLSIVGVVLSGLTLSWTAHIDFGIQDPLMAAVMAGGFTGMGVGFYLKYGGSAGGIDIVAAAARRAFGIPIGTTFMTINALVFVVGGLQNRNIETLFYSLVAIVVHSFVVERMQMGFSGRKTVMVVTNMPDEIAHAIMRRLNRGVTFLHGSSGMQKRPVRMIYTIVNMIELARLKEIIFSCDSQAFMAVNDTAEVVGYRFLTWADQGFEHKKKKVRS